MSKPKNGKAKVASRQHTESPAPSRQRVMVLGSNFKVRWEWRERF